MNTMDWKFTFGCGADTCVPVGNDVTYSKGKYGNSTQEEESGGDTPPPMPTGSQAAVGVFIGLGAAAIVGLLGYYGWTWYKIRSAGAGTPTKA